MVSMDAFARVISTPPTSNVARARQVTKKVSQGEFILDIWIVVGRYEYRIQLNAAPSEWPFQKANGSPFTFESSHSDGTLCELVSGQLAANPSGLC